MGIDAASERYVSLATFKKDGTEIKTPVWIAALDAAPVVYTNATSGKAKRIRRNGRVRVAPCSARGDVRGAWVDGSARIVSDEATRTRAVQEFVNKYGWQMRLALVLSRLSGRDRDLAIIELELSEA